MKLSNIKYLLPGILFGMATGVFTAYADSPEPFEPAEKRHTLGAGFSLPDHPFFERMEEIGAVISQPQDLPVVEGLIGYQVIHPDNGVPSVMYTSADGEIVLSGRYMDREGRDPVAAYITKQALANNPEAVEKMNLKLIEEGDTENKFQVPEKVVEQAVNKTGDEIWKALSTSLYFERNNVDEDTDRIVYIFIDPFCPRCAEFWPTVQNYAEQGLNFRVVPVSFIKPEDGMRKIVAMAMTQDPYKALEINEALFAQGGFPGAADVPEQAKEMLDLNLALMDKLQVPGTPGIIFQDENGVTKVVQELNESVLKTLAERN